MHEDKQQAYSMFSNGSKDDIIKERLLYFIYKGMGSSRSGRVFIIFRGQRVYIHNRNTKELHPYRNQPSRINRNEFNSYRRAYWKYRLTRYMEDKE